jgi:5-methylcytosine-specific restriction endonuclease McrA
MKGKYHGKKDKIPQAYTNPTIGLPNENLPEEDQDSELAAFTDAARADSIQDLKYRHEMYQNMVLESILELALKDGTRSFTREQRFLIYLNYDRKCANCGKECDQDDYHVDHIKPHSRGGATSVKNGQLLCPTCNLKKGSKIPNSK